MAGLVEKLIHLVGRAFYSDEHIVVLRALIREKFMKDDEMGNAVNLQTRQVRKIVNELYQDQLVCLQALNDKRHGGSSSMSYWYIDYKYFVDVVQYRLYMMHEHLKENEQLEIERQTFQCKDPDCGREYTALEAQLLLMPGQYQFRCGHCSEILIECDNNYRLERIQNMQRKFKDQMNKKTGMHDGIYELLRRIGEYVRDGHALPNNLPSDNRAAGLGGNSVRTTNNANSRKSGGGANASDNVRGVGGQSSNTKNEASYLHPFGSQEQEIIIDIAGNEPEEDEYLTTDQKQKQDKSATATTKKANTAMPEFLLGSSITGHLNTRLSKPGSPSANQLESFTLQQEAQGKISELQRQELFKRAYLAELERYNEESKAAEKVEIELDKQGWDVELNDEMMEEEEFDEMEWEVCGMQDETVGSSEVVVCGKSKPLRLLNDDDLQKMTDAEFLAYYQMYVSPST